MMVRGVVLLLLAGCLVPASEPAPDPEAVLLPPDAWPAPTTEMRPGTLAVGTTQGISTALPPGGSCTANFLFRNATDLFMGTAAHCLREPAIGGDVAIGWNGTAWGVIGQLSYSSYLSEGFDAAPCGTDPLVSMDDSRRCWNDFALIRIPPHHWGDVHPALRSGQGPTATITSPSVGTVVHTVGASHWRAASGEVADAREGTVIRAGSWGSVAYFAVPGTTGDSGSPVVELQGNPVGVLVYLHLAPGGSNGIAMLASLLDAAAEAGHPVELVNWT